MQKKHISKSGKPIAHYGLDIILAVGYRENSSQAMIFRQWATKMLKGYITGGYVINKKSFRAVVRGEIINSTYSE